MNANRQRLIADGIAAGLIGYGLVVLFFVLYNLAVGQPAFYTAALLGEALFEGLRDPAAVTVAAGPILAFNGVHMLAYLAFGFVAAGLVYETELHPEFWYVAMFLFLGAALLVYAAVVAIDAVLGYPLSSGQVVAASLLGAGGMAVYLTLSHPGVIAVIRAGQETPTGRIE